jgi:hypothetical protein
MQIDFYVYNSHEVVLWEPLWRALKALFVDAQFIVEPPGVCTATGSVPDPANGYRDIKTENLQPLMTPEAHAKITALLEAMSCSYGLRGRYGADAVVTTQSAGWLWRYRGRKLRTMYGVGATNDSYGHGAVNQGMDAVFVHGDFSYEQIAECLSPEAVLVTGYPKYAAYFRGEQPAGDWECRFGCDPDKKTIAYLPTWSHNSSLERFMAAVLALSERFNLLFKPHHNHLHFERERVAPLLEAPGVHMAPGVPTIVPFLACADLVLADVRSGAFTEAFLLDRPTIGLSPRGDRAEDNLMPQAYEAADVCEDPGQLVELAVEALARDPHRDGRRHLAAYLFADFEGQDDRVTAEAMVEASRQ